MQAHRLLVRLARRHGIPENRALRLQGMVERALLAREPIRSRLLELVERTLAREADRQRLDAQDERDAEERALDAIGRVLHSWQPPEGFDSGWLLNER